MKTHSIFCVCFIVVILGGAGWLAPSFADASETLVLSNGGKSSYLIHLSENPGAPVEFAAEELQKFFEKTTHVKLTIQKGNGTKSPCIWVGNIQTDAGLKKILGENIVSEMTKDKHFMAKDEYFCIKTSGKDLIIAGSGPRGTIYGVYEFLEEFLDCGFGYRSNLKSKKLFKKGFHVSEIVLEKDRIEIAPCEIVQGPAFPMRISKGGVIVSGAEEEFLWAFRNRFNVFDRGPFDSEAYQKDRERWAFEGITGGTHTHTMYAGLALAAIKKNNLTFDTQAILATQEDGTKVKAKMKNPRYCFSSSATVDFVVLGIKEFIKKHPETKVVLWNIGDGGIYTGKVRCHCPACKTELEKIKQAHAKGQYADWGEMNLKFHNKIIEKLVKDYPDLRVMILTYSNYSSPGNTKLHPNGLVYLTMGMSGWEGEGGGKVKITNKVDRWLAAVDGDPRRILYFEYMGGKNQFRVCGPNGKVFKEMIPRWVNSNAGGGRCRASVPFEHFRARVMWNPDLSYEKVVGDFARRNFHAAAPNMVEVVKTTAGLLLLGKQPEKMKKTLEEIAVALKSAGEAVKDDAAALANFLAFEKELQEYLKRFQR